ncbi:MAG: PD-(D/E)XK nuclease family protein, partial [Methanoregula sp.]|nr:PD-(D/E)XK nuclease family protein [Methanoregula sp.]
MDTTPIEGLRTSLQEQTIRAISEMRLSTALQNLVTLERVREFSESGSPEFDRNAFLAHADTGTEIDTIIAPPHQSIVSATQSFSASGLKTYHDCPLSYKFSYLYKIPTPPAVQLEFGSAIHSVIENLTKNSDTSRTSREQALALLDEFWTSPVYESATQESEARDTASTLLDTYLAWQEANPNRVIDTEKEFFFTVADRTIHGFIDRVEQTPKGNYVVIDFKSGKKPADMTKKAVNENIQMNIYCLAVQELYGTLPEKAEIFYLKDGKRVPYTPTEETIGAFKETLSTLINSITSEQFPANPEYQRCQWCAYGELCESREKEGS